VGAGTYANLTEAWGSLNETELDFEPQHSAVEAYNELYPRWRELNDYMLEAADRGLAPHMWKGAGA
jgi:autoinducer 2 (AI-2) kinase